MVLHAIAAQMKSQQGDGTVTARGTCTSSIPLQGSFAAGQSPKREGPDGEGVQRVEAKQVQKVQANRLTVTPPQNIARAGGTI